MSLTESQLAQCRAEFEAKMSTWCLDLSKDNVGDYRSERTDDAWAVWQAAWSPCPTVEDMYKLVIYRGCDVDLGKTLQAIHAALPPIHIHTDNTATLYNTLERIEELKADRDALLAALEDVWQCAWDGIENIRDDEKLLLDTTKQFIDKIKGR